MLSRLIIQNVALTSRAEFEFSRGLNVLSGETGAGKSVILDAIDFVLGAKADKSMIRTGEEECRVSAEFEALSPRVNEVLQELDIDCEDTLVISRKFSRDGRGSMKINGCSVTAQMLRRVSALLVDIHGQSDHFFLLKESNQLALLDSLCGGAFDEAKVQLHALLAKRREIKGGLQSLGGDEGERSRRMDILRFQIDEIERAQLAEGEEETLSEKKSRFENAEKIASSLSSAGEALSADGTGLDLVRTAQRLLSSASRYGEQYAALAERLESAAAELDDIAATVEAYGEELEFDEAEMARVEDRLDEIKRLKKKYGGSVAAVCEFLQRAQNDLAMLEDSGARREQLEGELLDVQKRIYAACCKMDEARRTCAKQFCAQVTEELRTLNIASARFEIEFSPFGEEDADRATENGLGGVRFLFSANAGQPLQELNKIISGGELSRFMLAIKALDALTGIGTYLFDEIDAGISGKTARVMGEKFCKIAAHTQIIAVSHLAQIAAFADKEYLIEKHEEEGTTKTSVHEVSGEARVKEIARLAGGDTESEISLRHAEELLKSAQTYKLSLQAR